MEIQAKRGEMVGGGGGRPFDDGGAGRHRKSGPCFAEIAEADFFVKENSSAIGAGRKTPDSIKSTHSCSAGIAA
jgi:hypothetical protein